MDTHFSQGQWFLNLLKKKKTFCVKYKFIYYYIIFINSEALRLFWHKSETILTISFLFILENNVFKIKVSLLVTVNHCSLSCLFTPCHLCFSFGSDQKTLHFSFFVGHHCHPSRDNVPRREGASLVHLVVLHREMFYSHDKITSNNLPKACGVKERRSAFSAK